MNKSVSYGLLLFLLLFVQVLGMAQENSLLLDFSANSLEGNQITILGPGFDSLPRGTITFGEIPTDNAFDQATDGQGAIVTCAPGQGLMIFAPVVQSRGALFVRCSVRANAAQGAVVIATVDQGANTFVATNTANNGAYYLNQYRRLALLSIPSQSTIQPLIQVHNPSTTESLTVYIDNFEVLALDPELYYSADYLNGDELDPPVVSLPSGSQPTPTPTVNPSPTTGIAPTPTPTLGIGATPTPTTIEVPITFLSISGIITSLADGSPVVGATVFVEGFPESRSESLFGGFYFIFANVMNTPPPYVLVVEANGFERFNLPLTPQDSGIISDLNLTLIPVGGATPNPSVSPTMTGTPTPTRTPRPTSTPTEAPSGAAVGLRLTVCQPYVAVCPTNQPALNTISVTVDLIDAQGRIVNPGTQGGDAARMVDVNLSGSATIISGAQTLGATGTVNINNPEGGAIRFSDTVAEKVSVTASAPGLNAAAPVTIDVLPTGSIQGTMRVWDGQQFVIPPRNFFPTVEILNTNSQQVSVPSFAGWGNDGLFRFINLLPGTYSLRFNPPENVDYSTFIPPLPPLHWACVNNITVTADQRTTGVNVDLGPQTGSRVFGTISRNDGTPIQGATVLLVPSSFVFPGTPGGSPIDCDTKFYYVSLINVTQDPNFDNRFEFKDVQPGEYIIRGWDFGFDQGSFEQIFFTNGAGLGETIVVQGDTEKNIVVEPGGLISGISPVDYRRLSTPPVFQWTTVTQGSQISELTLGVVDRCGVTTWTQDVTGTQSAYAGPPLSNQTIYSWTLFPRDANARFFNIVFSPRLPPKFLVE